MGETESGCQLVCDSMSIYAFFKTFCGPQFNRKWTPFLFSLARGGKLIEKDIQPIQIPRIPDVFDKPIASLPISVAHVHIGIDNMTNSLVEFFIKLELISPSCSVVRLDWKLIVIQPGDDCINTIKANKIPPIVFQCFFQKTKTNSKGLFLFHHEEEK